MVLNKRNHGLLKKPYRVKRYVLPFQTCNACPHKMKCAGEANITKSKGRYIERSKYQDYVDKNTERVKNNKELYRKRQAIVEHPYGTIKRQWGFNYILTKKTMQRANADVSFMFIACNLKQIMNKHYP